MTYRYKVSSLLSPAERMLFETLDSPQKVQTYLDTIPANVLTSREHTMRSPRHVIRRRRAHCAEGAMLAAAALAYHGHTPWLMSLESTDEDYDHVIAPFNVRGLWGAVSKTNYPVLRWRDPVYASPRELAMSYFHEYFVDSGKKTMRRYSNPFDIRTFDPARWIVANGDIDWLIEALGRVKHFPVAPPAALRRLRRASAIEIRTTLSREWRRDGTRSRRFTA